MKTGKLIGYQILILITIINTFYVFFGGGINAISLSKSFFLNTYQGGVIILLLWTIGLLVTLAHIVKKVILRKNLLRVSLIILSTLLLFSIIGRVIELTKGVFCVSCWINTALYLILVILTIVILKDLYKLIYELFE